MRPSLTGSRREKLESILQAEKQKDDLNNKLKKDAQDPAKYRGCMLSSHSVVPISTAANRSGGTHRSKVSAPGGTGGFEGPPGRKKLVHEKPESKPAPSMAGRSVRTEMEAKSKSEWALLTKFETEVYQEDMKQRKERRRQLIEAQREALDEQVNEHVLQKQEAKRNKELEAQLVLEEVERYKTEEENLAAEAKRYMDKIKEDRLAQVVEYREHKVAEKQKKYQEDLREIAAVKKSLLEEKKAALRRKDADKVEMEKTKVENAARIAARKQKEALQVEKDLQMAKDYIAMLEQQDIVRAENLKALYSRAGARAAVAGEQVVKEAKARAEAEEAMLKKLQADREAQLQREDQEAEERKRRTMEDNLKMLELQKKWREQEKAAYKEELDNWSVSVKEMDEKAKLGEAEKQRLRRERNLRHRAELEEQIRLHEANRTKWLSMTSTELKINEPLIAQAVNVVGEE